MMPNPRHSALAFLLGEHQLEPAEAEEALAVAAPVLDSSLARLLAAAEARHSAACAEAAHSLKGNLLNLGLPELAPNSPNMPPIWPDKATSPPPRPPADPWPPAWPAPAGFFPRPGLGSQARPCYHLGP